MLTLEIRRHIRAIPAVVWDVLTDVVAHPDLLHNVEAAEVLSPGDVATGFAWREMRRVQGRESYQEIAVGECRDYQVLGTRRHLPERTLAVRYELREADGGTELLCRIELETSPGAMVQQVASMLAEPWTKKRIRREFERDLDDLATAAESRQL